MEIAQIVAQIDSQLETLEQELQTLEAARSALTQQLTATTRAPQPRTRGAEPPAAAPGPRRARAPRRKRAGRRQALKAQTIEEILAGGSSLSTTEIAEQANADRNQVLAILRELESAGKAVRSGERRATRWSAFTDEDWVARRAAELEALAAAS